MRSPTGLSTINATVTQKLLLNREGTRDVTKSSNTIKFEVAITLMNTDAVAMMHGYIREIAFGIRIGQSKIWTALHEIEIDNTPITGPAPGTVETPTVVGNALLYNDISNNGGVYAGNAAVFRVEMTAPAGKWTNFDAEMTGDHAKRCTAIGVRIVDSGLTGYALDDRSVDSFDNSSNKVTTNFGDLHNPHSSDTVVTFELTIATDKSDPGTTGVTLPAATIGGQTITLPSFDILQNVRLQLCPLHGCQLNQNLLWQVAPAAMIVHAESYGFNDDWSITGQAALDLLVDVPSKTMRVHCGRNHMSCFGA